MIDERRPDRADAPPPRRRGAGVAYVQRPTNLDVDAKGRIYVSGLWWRPGAASPIHGLVSPDRPSRVSAPDAGGKLLACFGAGTDGAPGRFVAPRDICVDSRGNLYAAEVTDTFGVRPGFVSARTHTLQKLTREL